MRSADHIIALGPTGNVVEQGSFAELDSTNGYIKSLAIAQAKIGREESTESEHEGTAVVRDAAAASSQMNDLGDDARRLGDFSVYNYYRKALTLSRLSLFVGLEAFSIASYRFIREFVPKPIAQILIII